MLIGSFYDVALARAAHAAGMGAKIRARFNSERGLPCDLPFEADAEVVGLHDGNIVGRLGIFQGKRLRLGPCAALRIGGVTVVVISDRSQTADPMFFEMFGLDIGEAHTVAVKSRGHFRAGFRPWFPPEPGLRGRHRGVDLPGARAQAVDAIAAARLSPGRARHVDAAELVRDRNPAPCLARSRWRIYLSFQLLVALSTERRAVTGTQPISTRF